MKIFPPGSSEDAKFRLSVRFHLSPSQKQLLPIIGSTAAYLFLFITLYHPLGPTVTAFAMFPVVSAGLQFGLKGGLLAALLSLPVNALLLILEHAPVEVIIDSATILGHFLLILGGIVIGRMHELHERARKELLERKKVEEKLEESEARFRMLSEEALIGIYLIQDGKFRYVNPALARIFGYTPDELIDRLGPLDLTHPEDRPLVAQNIRLEGEVDSAHYTFRGLRKDGSAVYCEVFGRRVEYQGRPAILGTLLDITERKRTREVLEYRMKQLEALIHASQTVTASLDLDHVLAKIVLLANQVVASDYASVALVDEAGRLGQSVDDVPGVPSIRYRIREDGLTRWIIRSGRVAIIDKIQENGRMEPDWGEGAPRFANPHLLKAKIKSLAGLPLIAKDHLLGVLYLHSLRPGTFRGQEGVLMAFANQAAIAIENARLFEQAQREIKRRKRTEEALQKALKLREEMIQNVSHELRTPLALIRGYVELLQEGTLGDLTPQQQEAVKVLDKQSGRLHYMVERLLLFQALGRSGLKKSSFDLKKLLEEIIRSWELRAQRANIQLRLDIPSELPPLVADRELLHHVLYNLLDNAVKFSPRGGEVCIRARVDEGCIVLSVSDQGIGIPPDKLEQVFERFYQADGSSTRRFGGMGIGLALCRKIVEMHGGWIWAESEGEGKGSIFYVALPLADQPSLSERP